MTSFILKCFSTHCLKKVSSFWAFKSNCPIVVIMAYYYRAGRQLLDHYAHHHHYTLLLLQFGKETVGEQGSSLEA
jgi:hypothetical protein